MTKRQLVMRSDGKRINAVPHLGQLFVCGLGCCCGKTERGFASAHLELYHHEWERRKLRNVVHLTQSGCLGPCSLANVVLLWFAGSPLWFHSLNTERQVLALYDYIEKMVKENSLLPVPDNLKDYLFEGFVRPDSGSQMVIPLEPL